MFTNINDLKEFIQWAKSEKVQELKVGEVHIVFSALALTEQLLSSTNSGGNYIPFSEEPETEEERQKTLFHSV